MYSDERPDPDELLQRAQSAEVRAKRGRLKIFFGASAGVGKTYAMLAAARAQREQGIDVVVGLIETHGRDETARLLDGLEILPAREIDHRGRLLREFDLDAGLARRPAVMLVDELAHTNAPGSRHPKRWQDIEELLDAGIDVATTVNVQHLESLNDSVGGITGIRVWETVPDRVFDSADEVVLVDLPPDDLLQRLKEGKVYLPAQAERAIQNFFRKGNLIALRELALRRTADRVDEQMLTYRREHIGGRIWQTQDSLLVCVGADAGSEPQIRAASRLAQALDARWHAIYVETPVLRRLPEDRRERILRTLGLAKELGAQTATLSAQDAVVAVVDYAREHNLARVVVGRGAGVRAWRWPWRRHFAERIALTGPELDITIVPRDAAPRVEPTREREADAEKRSGVGWRYVWTFAMSAIVTGIAFALFGFFDLANIVMLFLLAVVIAAVRFGRGPAVMAAILNVLAFDFFFVPPHFSFAVSDVQYLLTFAIMLGVGLVVGTLTSNLRYQARVSSYREDRARNLYEMSRELSAALTEEQIAGISDGFVERAFRARAAVLLLDENDRLRAAASAGHQPVGIDMAVAQWAFDHGQVAGLGTDTLPATPQLYVPLKAPIRARGVLVIEPRRARLLMIPEQRQLLDTYATLIAIALERVHFVDVARATLVNMESERLRNSLLAALSHDLRTPLTALVGLAETLSRVLASAPREQIETVAAIRREATRTAQLVFNLLEMARLQAGTVKLREDWQSIEELVGAALKATEHALDGRAVEVNVPVSLPLIRADALLIERVLVNLIENAAKYAGPAARIGIGAHATEREVLVEVWDDGPGIPAGKEREIFEKFTRGDKESTLPGVGLGLSICRAIVAAHGGKIHCENRMEGGVVRGARFVFTLPRTEPPAPPIEEPVQALIAQ